MRLTGSAVSRRSSACPTRSSSEQYIQRVGGNGPVVAYVCKGVCKALWAACSPRAGLPFADLLAEEESKTICKNVALPQSAVQIREARDSQCIGRLITLSEADVAEINWLLGGRVNWHFIKLKGYAIAIILLIALLAAGMVYTKRGYADRRRRAIERKIAEKESESFLELNVNMY
ncbi:hypothetical protein, conserved [Babesia bigemina]|uniref:Uncharacterized protein n=1 Tax=Babesia bigemina TaxID=5866 RepID=A0A061DAJ6_BABBI|nr:hypothetical protein, conserved [Babesia bigemina]CDR95919.1 hypothetical protein, conserved [Babesia bigemina]|eukprot:XP_012768105.1 hypothetical protein, conserved [Babesia bigemina]